MGLVVRRGNKQWIEIVHRSGDVLRIQLYSRPGDPPLRDARVAFDDPNRNFEIYRPESERASRPLSAGAVAG
jgi:hypothetical protein